MRKKKTLTEADRFYIKSHLSEKDVVELSNETNATIEAVSEFIASLASEAQDTRTAEDKKKNWPVTTHNGAVIMTEAGSMKGDEALKKKTNPVDSKYRDYHKPLG